MNVPTEIQISKLFAWIEKYPEEFKYRGGWSELNTKWEAIFKVKPGIASLRDTEIYCEEKDFINRIPGKFHPGFELTPKGYLVYRALLAKYGEPEVPK